MLCATAGGRGIQLPSWTSHSPFCSSGMGAARGKGAKRGSRRSSYRRATKEEAVADLPQVWASSISTKKELVPALAEVGWRVGLAVCRVVGFVVKFDRPSVEQAILVGPVLWSRYP